MRTFIASLVAVMTFANCGISSEATLGGDAEITAEESSELSTTRDTYLMARRDYRRCLAPMCGGYWVKDVNSTMQERYVSGLDFTGSGLSDDVESQIFDAAHSELVLFGRLGPKENRFDTRPLMVKGAFRGMPGKVVGPSDKFYAVGMTKIACFTTPCANISATRINRETGHMMVTDVSVDAALATMVDGEWVKQRVMSGRAIVSGTIAGPTGNKMLSANQVFLALPERIQSCPRVAQLNCTNGKIPYSMRTTNRCTVPTVCGFPGACAHFEVQCDEGYSEVSWVNVCPRFACEPTFLQ